MRGRTVGLVGAAVTREPEPSLTFMFPNSHLGMFKYLLNSDMKYQRSMIGYKIYSDRLCTCYIYLPKTVCLRKYVTSILQLQSTVILNMQIASMLWELTYCVMMTVAYTTLFVTTSILFFLLFSVATSFGSWQTYVTAERKEFSVIHCFYS